MRQIEGVAGMHVMAVSWPEGVPQAVTNLGLTCGPAIETVVKKAAVARKKRRARIPGTQLTNSRSPAGLREFSVAL